MGAVGKMEKGELPIIGQFPSMAIMKYHPIAASTAKPTMAARVDTDSAEDT